MPIEANLPENIVVDPVIAAKAAAVSDCYKKIRDTLPKHLADYVIKSFPKATHFDGSYKASTPESFRPTGHNQIIINHLSLLSFDTSPFGACCGSQLIYDFYGAGSLKFIKDYMQLWCSTLIIPHLAILVKHVVTNQWVWYNGFSRERSAVYEGVSQAGRLIKEWRNPLHGDHLLCMYELMNHEKYKDYLDDLEPHVIPPGPINRY